MITISPGGDNNDQATVVGLKEDINVVHRCALKPKFHYFHLVRDKAPTSFEHQKSLLVGNTFSDQKKFVCRTFIETYAADLRNVSDFLSPTCLSLVTDKFLTCSKPGLRNRR